MGKVFEDYLSDIQKDMVSICLEYANYKVDKVFVYASNENNVISRFLYMRQMKTM